MIDFFRPVNVSGDFSGPQNLYHYMDIHRENHFPDWEEKDILIFDIPEFQDTGIFETKSVDSIRKALYKLFPGEWNIKIADLGSFLLEENEQDSMTLLEEILSHFFLQDKHLVILSPNQAYTYIINKALSKTEKFVNCSIIDSKIDLDPENLNPHSFPENNSYITQILWDEKIHLNNLHLVACQSYYHPPQIFSFLKKMYIDCFKLGNIKGKIMELEPELRTSHFLSLDIHAVEHAYMPLQKEVSPNGLNGLEVCQLTRYGGIGQNNKALGIFEYKEKNKGIKLGEELIAQMIWYYMEGKNETFLLENVPDKEEMIIFHVPNNLVKMKFYKQPAVEQWWVEIKDLDLDNRIFPCSYEDYQAAIQNKTSERIKKIMEKNKL